VRVAAFAPTSLFAAISDTTSVATVRESASFTPLAGHPIIINVTANNNSSTTREIALVVTIGTASRATGTGTALTKITTAHGFNGRQSISAYAIEGNIVTATAQTIQVSFDDGVNADTPRSIRCSGWQIFNGHATSVAGVATTEAAAGAGTTLAPTVTTGTAGSLVMHVGIVNFSTGMSAITTAGATELINVATGSTNAEDHTELVAWEAAAATGAYAVSWTWTTGSGRRGASIEVKHA
jgi:hypothetical protein